MPIRSYGEKDKQIITEQELIEKRKEKETKFAEIIELLWASLEDDYGNDNYDRKQTGWGKKTKKGLFASIETIMS